MTKQSILIVDDEPEFIDPQQEALNDAGYLVSVADNPDEAIDMLHIRSFDLIILDLLMPPFREDERKQLDLTETGVILLQRIRNEPELRNIPILFISVVRDPSITAKLRQIEGSNPPFLTKPVLPSVVVKEIEKIFK